MKHYNHETTVLGLFKNPNSAHRAINALSPLGYQADDISLISSREAYEKEEIVDFVIGEKMHQESIRAGKVGGLAGAVLGGATAITGFLTAGASLLATAPLIAFLTGAGGVLGGFLNAGFTEEVAKKIDQKISEGETLVLVHAENHHLAKQAKEIFKSLEADMVRGHH